MKTKDGESPVRLSKLKKFYLSKTIIYFVWIGGPPPKPKYLFMTDSEKYREGKEKAVDESHLKWIQNYDLYLSYLRRIKL